MFLNLFIKRAHHLVLSLLIALLLVTSGSMAYARNMMRDATGTMVLCTGEGTVTVRIGADGAPIEPSHICPECTPAVDAHVPYAFTLAEPRLILQSMPVLCTDCAARDTARIYAIARGPPVFPV